MNCVLKVPGFIFVKMVTCVDVFYIRSLSLSFVNLSISKEKRKKKVKRFNMDHFGNELFIQVIMNLQTTIDLQSIPLP